MEQTVSALEQQIIELRLALAREDYKVAARNNFAAFIQAMNPKYNFAWFHRRLANTLDRVVRGELTRVMINMPPRFGKTDQVSRMFPAYLFGQNPDMSIIATSYAAELASQINRDVQRIMQSEAYKELFPITALGQVPNKTGPGRKETRTNSLFEIRGYKGKYRSAGVGGGITGMGGSPAFRAAIVEDTKASYNLLNSILLIDDPIKNKQQANSPTYRALVWEWYTSTLRTRLSSGGAIILVMTRWHEEDLAGMLLAQAEADPNADQWHVLTLPAIKYYEDDSDPREIGDALWPEGGFDLSWCANARASGEDDWAGLYQQRPSVAGGGILPAKNWHFWWDGAIEPSPYKVIGADGVFVDCKQEKLPAKFSRQIQSWDCSFKDLKTSDFVAGGIWGFNHPKAFLLDQVHGRMGIKDTMDAIRAMSTKWPLTRAKLVEDKANGTAIMEILKDEISGLTPIEPDGGKISRAQAAAINQSSGNIFLPHPSMPGYAWVKSFIQEASAFPKGKHDDQVDQATQAINWLYAHPTFRVLAS